MSLAEHIVTVDTVYGPLLYGALFFGTFLHEGTAIATGAAFLVSQHTSAFLTAAALVAGIVTGDLGVYGLGVLARQNGWLQRRLKVASPRDARSSVGHRLIPVIAMCRVVPGLLFPTFAYFGWSGVPFRRFAATTIAVTMIYVPLLLTLFTQFGLQLPTLIRHWPELVAAAVVVLAVAYVGRRLWLDRLDRKRSAAAAALIPAD